MSIIDIGFCNKNFKNIPGNNFIPGIFFYVLNYFLGNSNAACAAANLAIGTRKGEQLT